MGIVDSGEVDVLEVRKELVVMEATEAVKEGVEEAVEEPWSLASSFLLSLR